MNDIRQEDMAEKLEVSRATLINYEKGHTTINIDVLDRLKVAYQDFELEEKTIKKPKIIQDNNINFSVLFNILYLKKNIIILSMIFSSQPMKRTTPAAKIADVIISGIGSTI